MLNKKLLNAEYIATASPSERIKTCEEYIQQGLEYFGCKLGLSLIDVAGNRVHQEIVVIDKKD